MNDLKEYPEKVQPYLKDQFYKLVVAYDVEVSEDRFNSMLKVIEIELNKKSHLTKYMLDNTYRELITNYTVYRKICPASYLTAFEKKNNY